MRHRHLDVPEGTPVAELGLAAIDDILDRGDLDDWKPLLVEIARDPWGVVAERVLHVVHHHRMYGTTPLFRGSWSASARATRSQPSAPSSAACARSAG